MANILIVDDERSIRLLLRALLERENHHVFEASNGRAGLDLYRERAFDLIITDLTMPEMDGIACIQQLVAIDPNVNILVISALSDKATGIEALKKGARGFLCKPFSEEQLIEALTELTED